MTPQDEIKLHQINQRKRKAERAVERELKLQLALLVKLNAKE